jgi:hypothetical protein
MIDRFGGLHGTSSVSDGRIEPAKQGEHVGEVGLRQCRLDDRRPKTLRFQITLERNVSLEQSDRIAGLAPDEVRIAKN